MARQIRLICGDAFKIEEGSVIQALKRLLIDDYPVAEWSVLGTTAALTFT